MKTKRLRRYQHWMRRTGCKWYMTTKHKFYETWKSFLAPATRHNLSNLMVYMHRDGTGRIHYTFSGPGLKGHSA